LSVTLDAVSRRHGFTILPRLAVAAELRDRGLVSAAITDPPVPAQLTLYTARGRATSVAAQQVIRTIKAQVAALRSEPKPGPSRLAAIP
jgi:DNA-binding transcriptional LysR family regulator